MNSVLQDYIAATRTLYNTPTNTVHVSVQYSSYSTASHYDLHQYISLPLVLCTIHLQIPYMSVYNTHHTQLHLITIYINTYRCHSYFVQYTYKYRTCQCTILIILNCISLRFTSIHIVVVPLLGFRIIVTYYFLSLLGPTNSLLITTTHSDSHKPLKNLK